MKRSDMVLRRISKRPYDSSSAHEPKEGLDYIKFLFYDTHKRSSAERVGYSLNAEGVKQMRIQVPLENSNLVAHIEIQTDGKVSVCYRERVFNGFGWVGKLDVMGEATMQKLAGHIIQPPTAEELEL